MKNTAVLLALLISSLLYSCSEEPIALGKSITHEFMDTTQIAMPLDTMVLVIYPKNFDAQSTVEAGESANDSLIIISKIKGTYLASDAAVSHKSFSMKGDTILAMIDYQIERTKKHKSPSPQTTPSRIAIGLVAGVS